MNVTSLFEATIENLKVGNAEEVHRRRDELTKLLNKEFRDSDSNSSNRLMVGSWGRNTAIHGVSDLDLIYILPQKLYEDAHAADGPYNILSRARKAISQRYPDTDVRVSQLVVVVQFANFKFEIQPCFEAEDGSFEFPDTYSDSWKRTDPRSEIAAMRQLNAETSGNARILCRLARAWKRKHKVQMGGLLIDTLVWRFFQQSSGYKDPTLLYDHMLLEFFTYLGSLPRQSSWNALGSNQKVQAQHFQSKAKKAAVLCQEAIDAEDKSSMPKKWSALLGWFVPLDDGERVSADEEYFDTEEFIEDLYPVKLKYSVDIQCIVTQKGFRTWHLPELLRQCLPLLPQKQLEFSLVNCTVPRPFEVRWKVLNRGEEALMRNQVRGQIFNGKTSMTHVEHTLFAGDHYVECYIVKDGVIVARAHQEVPIRWGRRSQE